MQKIARLQRDIAHFAAQIERFKNPQSPREKAALTLSQRKLAQRRKLLELI
ncbi:hypothetical protein R2083_08260 [Nitrosomonas sp. Is35]|uniref:hypothetical protein n=1 Tax=Nitrosomonas sp. Is35 TaxID=3080534 RepID=UPI00294B5BC2|nr:hypothetical protein [Nitrosomonas sp. Is35]MDV6347506.1 hypothetical protein [Nitrosomonas sp. Is35]